MEKMHIESAEQMLEAVAAVLDRVGGSEFAGAVVVALSGDLGAGKTTFTQALARTLGVVEDVTSPTFVIMKGYELPAGEKMARPFSHLIHIDAYRIEDIDEMRVLGFAELLKVKGTIICIEWAENIAALIPEDALRVMIEIVGEAREVTIE